MKTIVGYRGPEPKPGQLATNDIFCIYCLSDDEKTMLDPIYDSDTYEESPFCNMCYHIIPVDAKNKSFELIINEQELATILAALRYWQQDLADNERNDEPGVYDVYSEEFFTGVKPLTPDQIDTLCERINT